MMATAKILLKLPAERRRELADLAYELDTTSSELIRLGVIWVLANRDTLRKGPRDVSGAAAEIAA